MKHNKEFIKQAVENCGVIAVIRGVKEESLPALIKALSDGGITVAELTFGVESDQDTALLIKKAVELADDNLIIGAGTVVNACRAKLALEGGAKFVVSPNFNGEVIDFCSQKGIVTVCGALTPSEIYDAHTRGADFIKIFPSSGFGASYFKAVRAPFPQIPLFAFGGITGANLGEYIKAGAIGVGIGSELINLKAINAGDFDFVTNKAKELVNEIKRAKE
ncbi:MAG: bifunctional 4-hydroxy-2-oxoglutarate aldolase/2-dehydro-3-deoxy-phosphogluconate aldolase [Clostridia bacterium]|nr:bifunctional 4-hydroxy-2-oxoglutarate aldolase/2-dehydro-3-deoxy-phosphogluconate aldolase [Clostridia bacterium]